MVWVDLLDWTEIHDAETAVVAAEDVRLKAARQWKLAPPGERQLKLQRFRAATEAALQAAAELDRLKQGRQT